MRTLAITLAGLVMVGTPSALANEYFGTFGTWPVFRYADSCSFGDDFEGPGEPFLMFTKYADGGSILGVTNENWSAKKGEEYEVTFLLDGVSYTGKSYGVAGGFAIRMPSDFERHFSAGNSLSVFLGDELELIQKFSLKGTAVAVAALNRCLAGVHARLAAEKRERERWEHLPKDPFAGRVREPSPTPNPENSDIAAPLRAAQTGRKQPSGDEQLRQLFDNWQSLESSEVPALREVGK